MADQLTQLNYKVTPGQKLCPECWKHPSAPENFGADNEEGIVNTDDEEGVGNNEKCHLPDETEAWTTKKAKIKIF